MAVGLNTDRIERGQGPTLFNNQAPEYAKFRPTYPPALFSALAALCGERELAWDVGCGSGQATLGLAHHFGHVIGSDVSQGQLGEAKAADNVEYCLLNAEWPLERIESVNSRLVKCSVDLITVAQALHWFDLEKFYATVKAVLKPDGLLAVWTYNLPVIISNPEANILFKHIYRNVVGPYWAPERVLVDDCYATIPFPFEEVLTCIKEPWGVIKMTWDIDTLMGYLKSWSSTQKAIEALGYNPIEAHRKEFERLWSPQGESIDIPLYLRVGSK